MRRGSPWERVWAPGASGVRASAHLPFLQMHQPVPSMLSMCWAVGETRVRACPEAPEALCHQPVTLGTAAWAWTVCSRGLRHAGP